MKALIVIDVQESFCARPNWSEVSNPSIVDNVNALVRQTRSNGDVVVWVLHSEPDTGGVFDPKRGLVELQRGLIPNPEEPVLTKTSRNAFTTTNLGQILQQHGVTSVTIAGIQTEQCCETTARLAADMGFTVAFVTDATATFPIVRPDTGAVLATDAIIERTEFALAGRFATIVTTDEYAGSLAAS